MIGDCLMNVLNKCSVYLSKVLSLVSAALLNPNALQVCFVTFAEYNTSGIKLFAMDTLFPI